MVGPYFALLSDAGTNLLSIGTWQYKSTKSLLGMNFFRSLRKKVAGQQEKQPGLLLDIELIDVFIL